MHVAVQVKPFNWRHHSRDVLEFQRETYQVNFPGFVADRQFMHDYGGQIRRSLGNPSEGLFVLEDGRRVAGFLWVALISTMIEPCVGYIKNIYVAPDLRGLGHARRLVTHAEAWCLRKGVTRICLDASCCNQRAMRIYQEAGYETVRVRMEKDLDPASLGELERELASPPATSAATVGAVEVS